MGWRVNKIFRKPGAPGVRSWMPRVSAPSGGREPPGTRWKERGPGLGTGWTPIDSAGLKVRRDKRTGPDGTEEPLAATAYKGGKRTRLGLGFIPWDSALLEAGGGTKEGYVFTCVVCGVRAANGCTCGSRLSCSYLRSSRIVRRLAGRKLLAPALSRLYNGNWAYTFCAAYTGKSNSMVTARANFMSINDATNFFFFCYLRNSLKAFYVSLV